MSIYLVQIIGYSFEKAILESEGVFNQILASILGMLMWGVIVFLIVMLSPPFRNFFLKWFNVDSETEKTDEKKKNSENTASKPTAHNGKKGFGKLDLAVIISIISLIVSGTFAGIGIYLTTQANDLTEQAIDIADRSLALQNMQINYSTTIITNPNQLIILDKGGNFDNETGLIACRGWLNGTITVITPSFGTLSVNVVNFTVNNVYENFDSSKTNSVFPDTSYIHENENLPVVSGLNQFNFTFFLESHLFPYREILPPPEHSQTISAGALLLEAKLETQTDLTISKYFYADVFVNVKNY